MPLLQTQHFLESARAYNHIGSDVHGFFMHLDLDADRVVQGLDRSLRRRAGFGGYWHALQDSALACEARFLEWRAANRKTALGCSIWAYQGLPHHVETFIEGHAHLLVDHGFERLSDLGMQLCEQRYGYSRQLGVILRSANRARSDLGGFAYTMIQEGEAVSEAIMDTSVARRQNALVETLREVERYRRDGLIQTNFEMATTRNAQRYIRKGRERQRRIVNRSISFAERLLGPRPVRLFIGGSSLRVEGRHAVYEITRKRHDDMRDGDARLAVFTREGDIELCHLCIHTRGVPMLDHVTSIVMHIRADNEEEILRVGNPYKVTPAAYEQDWLVPFLPKRRRPLEDDRITGRDVQIPGMPRLPVLPRRPREIKLPRAERDQRIRAVSNLLLDRLMDDHGHRLPRMDATVDLIRTGERAPDREIVVLDTENALEAAQMRATLNTAIQLCISRPDLVAQARREGVI